MNHSVTPELLRAVSCYMFERSPIAAIAAALEDDSAPEVLRNSTAVSIVKAIGQLEAARPAALRSIMKVVS